MQILNTTTNEIVNLSYAPTGCDCLADLIQGSLIKYNKDEERYEAPGTEIDFWRDWISTAEKADKLESELAEKLGDKYAASEISAAAAEAVEFNDQPTARINAILAALGTAQDYHNTQTAFSLGMKVTHVDDEGQMHQGLITEITGTGAQIAFNDGDEGFERYETLFPTLAADHISTLSVITISIQSVKETPFTLSLDIKDIKGPHYFDENDGTSLAYLLPAFADLAQEIKIESNSKNDAWLSTWDSESLAKIAGKTIVVEYTEFHTEDEDGEPVYESCTAKRISLQ